MTTLAARPLLLAGALLLAAALPSSAEAQGSGPYQQVISANPFGLLLEFFNAEYERVATESSAAGVGGSYIDLDGDNYVNFDAFWRFYPSGEPLNGWAFGGKLGVTRVNDGNFFGFGFDVNRSWLMGANENFYVGVGVGLKRLLGADEDLDTRYIPTVRLVNVGFAF